MPKDALDLLVPHLAQIESWTAILLDTSREAEHEDAADSILRALCHGAQSFETLLPVIALSSLGSISFDPLADRHRLSTVGYTFAQSLRERRIDWPPSDVHPPGVVIDLLGVYDRFDIDQRLGSADLTVLRTHVQDLRETSCRLARSGTREEKIQVARRAGDGPLRGPAFRFLSATALLIGLLQGPSTILDVYPDSAELAHVIAVHVQVLALDVYRSAAPLVGADTPTPRPEPLPEPTPQPTPQAQPELGTAEFAPPYPTDANPEFARPAAAGTSSVDGFANPNSQPEAASVTPHPTVRRRRGAAPTADDGGRSILEDQQRADARRSAPKPDAAPGPSPGG